MIPASLRQRDLLLSEVLPLSGSAAVISDRGRRDCSQRESLAKGVEILNLSEDLILSDNYFDMSAGERE